MMLSPVFEQLKAVDATSLSPPASSKKMDDAAPASPSTPSADATSSSETPPVGGSPGVDPPTLPLGTPRTPDADVAAARAETERLKKYIAGLEAKLRKQQHDGDGGFFDAFYGLANDSLKAVGLASPGGSPASPANFATIKSVTEKLTEALTRVEDILLAEDCGDLQSRAAHFLRPPSGDAESAESAAGASRELDCEPFLRAMATGDAFCQRAASAALATLLAVFDGSNRAPCAGPLEPFVQWLCDQLAASRGGAAPGVRAAVPALTILLRREDARALFGRHGGVGYLTKLLKAQGAAANAQLLYELSFCLWTLSFCASARPDFATNGTIGVLVEQVTSAPREKVRAVGARARAPRLSPRRVSPRARAVGDEAERPSRSLSRALSLARSCA